MFEYIQKLRTKPKVVRERIAVGASLGITGVIAAGWIAVMVVTNPFAAPTPTVADEAGSNISKAFSESKSGFQNLLGAAAASKTSADESGITIVDTTSAETNEPAPTVIPF